MAAGRLPQPGAELGPCEGDCDHVDCTQTMAMAAAVCSFCKRPIGFETRFYQREGGCLTDLDHADCAEDAAEGAALAPPKR